MERREWVLTVRLKHARQRKELSQRRLGILIGIHEDSAGSRINQYEHGVHEPDFRTLQRVAKALEVPTAYFYAEDDLLADLILLLDSASDGVKRRILRSLKADSM